MLVGGQLKGDHADGVAVGLGIRNGLVADDSAAAGAVVNRQGDAQVTAHGIAERAEHRIRSAAGSPRADHGDTLGRVISSRGDGHHAQHEREGDHQSNQLLHKESLLESSSSRRMNGKTRT